MYENTGKKILSLARVLTVLMMVVVIITGIGIGVGISAIHPPIGLISAVLVIVIGCLSAWLSNLLLAGFGELVSNSFELLQIAKHGGVSFGHVPSPKAPGQSNRATVPPQQHQSDGVNPGEWVCVRCNAINQNKISKCWDCGTFRQ